VREKRLYSKKEEDGTLVARMKPLEDELARLLNREKNAVVEGHLGCEMRLPVDIVIVTRTNPSVLERRLRARGYAEGKAEENAMAEALDYATALAAERYERVFEVDTTKKNARKAIAEILAGKGERFRAGRVRWSAELAKRACKSF